MREVSWKSFPMSASAILLAALPLALATTLLCSCESSPKGERLLTVADKERLTEYARAFLLRSKIQFGEEARKTIATTRPKLRCFIENDGTGRISLSWPISSERVIKVFGKGDLDKVTDCSWKVSIINMKREFDAPRENAPRNP